MHILISHGKENEEHFGASPKDFYNLEILIWLEITRGEWTHAYHIDKRQMIIYFQYRFTIAGGGG